MTDKGCVDLSNFFALITNIVFIFPILIAFFRWQYLNKPLRVFLGYCVVTVLLNLLEWGFIQSTVAHWSFWEPILQKLGITNTFFLLILYHLKNFIFLGWFFSLLLTHPAAKWVRGIVITLSIAAVVNYIFIEGYQEAGRFNPTADAIFTFILPLYYLWRLYRAVIDVALVKNAYFWISLGLLIPNVIALYFYFTSPDLHNEDYCLFLWVNMIKNFFEIIGSTLLAIGFWRAPFVKYITKHI
ncbi:MAG TPA: hypothetical protein PKD70_11920 [Saprospiraceae bacterium]|nr:hypothetical protein [Saprospiraceae bacterium]HMP14579.1 hypothetical protein [Saprospiraceae bacterium]